MTFTFGESDDRSKAWGAGLILLMMMMGHTALETARDSLFLARLPVQQLPFTYAAIAVAALGAAEVNARLRARFDLRQLFSLTLMIGAAGSVGFMRLFQLELSWAPHAFYVWTAVVATLITTQFWLVVSEHFTVLQAKSAFAVVSAGGLVGAMLGGGTARVVAERRNAGSAHAAVAPPHRAAHACGQASGRDAEPAARRRHDAAARQARHGG